MKYLIIVSLFFCWLVWGFYYYLETENKLDDQAQEQERAQMNGWHYHKPGGITSGIDISRGVDIALTEHNEGYLLSGYYIPPILESALHTFYKLPPGSQLWIASGKWNDYKHKNGYY